MDEAPKRGPGRPRVGASQINLRMPPDELAALDDWIAKQPEPMERTEALRLLARRVTMKRGK
jgi:hypothetical protein